MNFKSPAGGVMTREVGAVTGKLSLKSEEDDGRKIARVAYEGSDEFYTVVGSVDKSLGDEDIVKHLTADVGYDEFGNAKTVDLSGLSD